MIFKKERDDAWIAVNSNDCSVLCISYEKGKKHTERYYIGVKNRATESEYSIKK